MTARTTIHTASRYQKRQNQTRRRAITSSCCSALSAPNRLGQGMNQRNTMSTRPRNAITSMNVQNSAHGTLRPAWEWNQTNAAGLVRTATMVAARVSLRRSRARPELPVPPGANRRTGSSLAIRQVYWWTFDRQGTAVTFSPSEVASTAKGCAMTGMRRATVAVAATVVLSGLAGAAAGCAGGTGSSGAGAGGGATAAKQSLRASAGSALAGAAPLAPSATGTGSVSGASEGSGGSRADVSAPVPSAVIKTASLDLRVAHGKFGDAMNAATDVALRFGGYVSRRTSFGSKVHD